MNSYRRTYEERTALDREIATITGFWLGRDRVGDRPYDELLTEAQALASRREPYAGVISSGTPPVYYYGDRNYRDAVRATIGPDDQGYILVGRFQGHRGISPGAAPGTITYAVEVTRRQGWETVGVRYVRGHSVYEPATRNQIGGLGAYRDVPPSQAEIDAAIAELRAQVPAEMPHDH